MTDSALADNAPQTERLYTLAEVAKATRIPAADILKACRGGALPGVVLVERHGKTVYAFTQEALCWLLSLAKGRAKRTHGGERRTLGMLHLGGSYHAMCGILGRDGRRVRHG